MLVLFVVVLGAAAVGPAVRAWRAGRRAAVAAAGGVALAVVAGQLALDPVSQKVVSHLVMPTGLVWLGLAALAGEAAARRERRFAGALVALFAAYTAAGNILLGTLGLLWLQAQVPALDWREGPPFDAVLVLGGGTKPAPAPNRFELSPAGDRVLLGARLYRAGRARVLVTSGRGVPGLSEDDLTEATLVLWQELGVPAEAVIRLREPWNTQQELEALRPLVAERGWRRVGLVTSAYHLPRALAQARRVGLDVIPVAADHVQGPDRFDVMALLPQVAGFVRVHTVVWEVVGRLVGR